MTERIDEQPLATASIAVAAASIPGRIYEKGDAGVSLPVPISMPRPQYTREAMQAKIQGQVKVACVVLPDGSVGEASIVESLDRVYGLDEAALKAARVWRFTPGTNGNHPVAVRVEVELTFGLR